MSATLSAPPSVAARPLFEALYGNAQEDHWFALWTSPGKSTFFFRADAGGIEDALAKVDELDGTDQNLYMSLYLLDTPKKKGRGEAKDVKAICALWIDVDVKGPNHKSQTAYPPSMDAAIQIVQSLPIPASAVFNSGGGIHAYWFFPEPLALDTDDERADVLDILKRWKVACQAAASSHGFAVDSVWDLTRVLRVPCSKNQKTSPPVRCTMLEFDASRTYGQLDIEEILPDAPDLWVKGKAEPISMVGIDLRYMTVKPEKVLLALEGDPKFKLTWERKRKDFTDQSSSAYSFSLAQYFVKLGLTDEQIVQLLYTWRQDHGASPKNDNWYAKEVGRARQAVGIESSTVEFLEDFKAGEVTERSDLLKGLSQVLGFEIDRLQRIDGARVTYRIKANGHDRNIGGADTITSYLNFSRAMTDLDVAMSKEFSKKGWKDEVVPLFLAAAERRELGQGDTEAGRAQRWIYRFLGERSISEGKPGPALREGRAFIHDDLVTFFPDTLLEFVRTAFRNEALLETAEMEQALEQVGCTQTGHLDIYPNGRRRRLRAWSVPKEIYSVEAVGHDD